MPERASVNYGGPIESDGEHSMTLREIRGEPDATLLRQAKESVSPPFDDGTTLVRERSKGPMIVDLRDTDRALDKRIDDISLEPYQLKPAAQSSALEGEEARAPAPATTVDEPSRQPWYLLPPWSALLVLAAGVAIGIVVVRSMRGRRER